MEKNVHSDNDKANSIIYFLGMSCFIKGWAMTRLDNSEKPDIIKDCNPAYTVEENNKLIHYIGFEDKTETMYIISPDALKVDKIGYDEAIRQFTKR